MGRQLQHHNNGYSAKNQVPLYDGSSEEKTLFHYIPNYSRVLDQSLV